MYVELTHREAREGATDPSREGAWTGYEEPGLLEHTRPGKAPPRSDSRVL